MSRSAEGGGRPGPIFSERSRAERRARAARLGAPVLVPLAAGLVAAALLWRNWEALTGISLPIAAAAPETQVREALRHQDRASLADVYGFHAGGTAELYPVTFGDVTVSVEAGQAKVLAVVEAQGRVVWRGERATLGYVGREAFAMTPCSIALWCGDGEQFARLRGVLHTLFRRADAAAEGDAEAAARLVSEAYAGAGGKAAVVARLRGELHPGGPPAHVRAWQIRVERDRAEAGEDQEVEVAPGKVERRRAVYRLTREDGRWRFLDGL